MEMTAKSITIVVSHAAEILAAIIIGIAVLRALIKYMSLMLGMKQKT